MYAPKKFALLSFIVLITLVLSLVFPMTALADDGTPPPNETPTVEAPPPDGGTDPVSTDAAPTDAPVDAPATDAVSTEVAPTDAPADTTVTDVAPTDVAPTDAPADVTATDVAPTEVAVEPTADVVAALNDAGAVLLDANGEPIPLASQEAAGVLSNGDPYVVRAGVTNRFLTDCTGQPVDAFNTCTVSSTPIQAAINFANPGETVNVEAGTYDEVLNITKSITLQGQTGVILRPDNTTALLDGGTRRAAIYINSVDGVTVNGFEIDGTGGTVHYGIYGLNADNTTISNNISHDITNQIDAPGGDVAGVGILLFGWGQGIDNAQIQNNTVFNTGRMGIFVGGMQTSGDYLWLPSTADITNNTVYNTWQGPTDDWGGAVQVNAAIDSNIEDNRIHHTGGDKPGVYIAGSSTGNAITQNEIYNNTYGVTTWSDVTFVEYLGNPAAAPDVNFNSIHDNSSYGLWNVDSDPTYMVDASGNWWGTNTAAGVAGEVTANVDYTPWLNSGTDTNLLTPGFQGDFSILNVDDNSPQTGTTGRIQEGVNMVSGSTVNVMPGTYTEQVVIDGKNVTLQAAAPGVTVQAPASVPTCFTTSGPNKPIICAKNADSVFISGLTVDGLGLGNANYRFDGIGFYNAGGTISNNTIQNITNSPLDGSQHGVGLYVYNDDGTPRTVTVTGNTITNYQKNGMALSGDGLMATVTNNTVTGAGPTSLIAQNGIQLSYGAVGTISNNTVSGNFWTGTYGGSNDPVSDPNADGASGILLYDPGTATVQVFGNNVFGNQFGIASVGATDLNIHDNTIQGAAHTGNGYPAGIAIWDWDQWSEPIIDTTGTIQNNTITLNDYGILINNTDGETSPDVGIHNNSITANTLYGVWSNALTDATNNWWGASSGPLDNSAVPDACGLTLDNPFGAGDSVSPCVLYDPWTGNPVVGGGGEGEDGGGQIVTTIPPAVIPVTGGQEVTISCDSPSVTMQMGDIQITFTGLCGYSVILNEVAKEGLPGDLGDGNTFVEGLSITLLKDGEAVGTLPAGTGIRVSYPNPAAGGASVMAWDGSAWGEETASVAGDRVEVDLTGSTTLVLVTH